MLSIDFACNGVKLFASQNTPDSATGARVGALFQNPDNLAIDVKGHIASSKISPAGWRLSG